METLQLIYLLRHSPLKASDTRFPRKDKDDLRPDLIFLFFWMAGVSQTFIGTSESVYFSLTGVPSSFCFLVTFLYINSGLCKDTFFGLISVQIPLT